MRKASTALAAGALLALGATGFALAGAGHDSTEAEEGQTEAGEGHAEGAATMQGMGMMPGSLEEAREMHKAHEHGHDFEVMEEMSAGQLVRVMALMSDIGVATPPMSAARGREVFVQKGCVACHAVNGVGGDLGPSLNAADMPSPMNAFEFAARMWRGAQAMTALQEDMMGEVISLTGQDLADLVAFAHDEEQQAQMDDDHIPDRYRALIAGE
jgi:mono/diheme cytochrome c family protein